MRQVLLDTDTLSAVMRKHPAATAQAQAYLVVFRDFTLSIMTRYEILRGLRAKGATVQLAAFERFCAANQVLPITDEIIVRASEIYADLYRQGSLISDADILIAASALVYDLALVTNNEGHFKRIAALRVENWLK